MALKKKRIGELEGSPLVVGDANLVNEHETLVEMNPDNTIKDIKKREGDLFHTIINNETINSLIDLLNELMEDGEFGALVLSCQASVSDNELISLFGDEKALNDKSRRQALIEQLLQAYSIEDDLKILDFSKLPAIGNGEKVNNPIFAISEGVTDDTTELGAEDFNVPDLTEINIIVVMFDTDSNRIVIANTSVLPGETYSADAIDFEELGVMNGYGYLTCSTKGDDVHAKSFGTFTIKTRAEE